MVSNLHRNISLETSRSLFLFGARGTGKTTLIKERFSDEGTLTIDLLRSSTYNRYSLDPDLLHNEVAAQPDLKTIIIDEVQRLPHLLNEVHSLMEENKHIQFILTGSSARKLKRGGSNLLAGRAQVHNLHPLTWEEIGPDFDLVEALRWGTLPEIYHLTNEVDKKEFLYSYTMTYLQEEILQEQLIRKLETFQRFLPIAAQMSGKVINYSSIAKDIGVAPQTVENYFSILTDTLLGFHLPAYHASLRKQERKSPKYYLFDTGVTRALGTLLDHTPTPKTSYYGELFEQFVLLEVFRKLSYQRRPEQLFYYQTDSGLEIDLVMTHPQKPTTFIEIKSTTEVKPKHLGSLKKIAAAKPDARFLCLSQDPKTQQFEQIRCLPRQKGLAEL